MKHEWRTCDTDGCISGKDFYETEFSARPVPPYPFLNEILLDESQRHRIHDVWESSRALQRSRNDVNHERKEMEENVVCTHCENTDMESKVLCSACGAAIHTACLESNDSEWGNNAVGHLACKSCSSFDRMAF